MLYSQKILLENSKLCERPLKAYDFKSLTHNLEKIIDNCEYDIMNVFRLEAREAYLRSLPKTVLQAFMTNQEYFNVVKNFRMTLPEINKSFIVYDICVPIPNNVDINSPEIYVGSVIKNNMDIRGSKYYVAYNRLFTVGSYYSDIAMFCNDRQSTLLNLFGIDRYVALVFLSSLDFKMFCSFLNKDIKKFFRYNCHQ